MNEQEMSFEEFCRRRTTKPVLRDDAIYMIGIACSILLMVLGFSLFPKAETGFFVVVGSIVLGMWTCSLFESTESLRRDYYRLTETAIQRPQRDMRKALGRFPTTEQLKDYTGKHLWFRQPYCHEKSCAHCSQCQFAKMKDQRYRVGKIVVKSEGIASDCRGRPPIERPVLTVCSQCKFARRHKYDDFFDCTNGFVTRQDDAVPAGKNIYEPLYYPVDVGCPYFEKTTDPAMLRYDKACRKEWDAWTAALDGRAQLDLDERYGKDG